MLKKHMAACLVASALVAAPAFAQTTTQPARPAQPGGTQMTTPPATTVQPKTSGTMAPLAAAQPNQILGSDLRGTKVYGANNENIGEINDTLIDRNGQVVAVIVGVGGFLGIGEKNVAIPFQSLQFAAAPATGTTGTTTGTTGARTGTMEPDRIVLQGMTKKDLEAAPSFKSDRRAGTTGTTTGTTGTTGTTTGTTPGTTTTAPGATKPGMSGQGTGSQAPAGSGMGSGSGTAPRQ